jgi:hypothetical protein
MMTTEKTLLIIGSAPFIIDTAQQELRRFNRPDYKIPFDHLKNEGPFYSYRYTGKAIGVYERIDLDNIHDVTIDLIIPSLIMGSNGLITAALKSDLNRMGQKEGWGFFLGDESLAMRLSGKLPHIDLAGTDFTIDWRLKELRETELPWKHIGLQDLEMSDSGEEYLCFYNTETHELFEPDENLLDLPENVVVLEIPCEAKLDPVAVAREYGIGETDLLNDHPFQMNLKAKVTPLSETGLPEYIQNNKRLAAGNSLNNENQSQKRGR